MRWWTWEDTFEIIGDTVKGIIIGVIVGGTGTCIMLLFTYACNQKIFGLG
jgi:hypothetical protein